MKHKIIPIHWWWWWWFI